MGERCVGGFQRRRLDCRRWGETAVEDTSEAGAQFEAVVVEGEAVAGPLLTEEVGTRIPAVQRTEGRAVRGPSFVPPAGHAEHLAGELAKESAKRQDAAEKVVEAAEPEAAMAEATKAEAKSQSWANALYFSALGGPKTCVPQIAL